jgi:hypothetical protein
MRAFLNTYYENIPLSKTIHFSFGSGRDMLTLCPNIGTCLRAILKYSFVQTWSNLDFWPVRSQFRRKPHRKSSLTEKKCRQWY